MWPNPQENSDLVTFTEKILDGNFSFCAVCCLDFYGQQVFHNTTFAFGEKSNLFQSIGF